MSDQPALDIDPPALMRPLARAIARQDYSYVDAAHSHLVAAARLYLDAHPEPEGG